MRYFSAFTGVGGFDMGMLDGWECIGHSEIDKYANMVLRYRFRDVKNYGNIEKINWKEVPDFDLLCGGTPCQDLSVAGKRAGLAGRRSGLFFEFIRALREKKPRYFIWENVKGALSSNGGWDFAKVLLEFYEIGYAVWWQLLDATDFGIPQHRERIFVVGTPGNEPPIKVLFEPADGGSASDLSEQQTNTITKRYRGAQATGSYIVESELNAQKRLSAVIQSNSQVGRVYDSNGIAPSLHRKTGGSQVAKIVIPISAPNRVASRSGIYDGKYIRYLTPLECERLMGWPDDWTRYGINNDGAVVEISDNQRYNLIGNGVVPQIVRRICQVIEE